MNADTVQKFSWAKVIIKTDNILNRGVMPEAVSEVFT